MQRSPLQALFIEDSELDVELLLHELKRDGFDVAWRRVAAEEPLREALDGPQPNIVFSDFSMPGFDGMEALRIVQELAPRTPFVFVSGTIGEERAIEAIRVGATDYVLKDNLRRLTPAVRRALTEAAERERGRAAAEERARLVEIMEATPDYVALSDIEGNIEYLNAAGRAMVGLPPAGAIDRSIRDLHPAWAIERIEGEGRPAARCDGVWQGETALLCADGTEIPVSQQIIAHHGPEGGVRFYSTIARDIRDRKAYEARIEHYANFDALTDLPNRRLLGDRVAQAITHARRAGRPCALLVLDLDRFDFVNASLGHETADALLGMIAARLQGVVRDGDTVARIGSGAFAVLVADLARAEDVLVVARKTQDGLLRPFPVNGREMHVTLSMGASVYPRDGMEFEDLLRNANAALHRVRSQGGGKLQFYTEAMTREAADRVELEHDLRSAVSKRGLEVHFQPQVTLANGVVVGVEALMRWQHDERGWIPPSQFIPVAEEVDLIDMVSEFALTEGCRRMREWDRAGFGALRLAINVSPQQLRHQGIVEQVATVLNELGLPPDRLELEMTESVVLADQNEAVALIRRLKALGVRIAIDDFGTGYSNLGYLSQLPIDCLKIDRSFVHRIGMHERDAAIARAIVSLAHSLQLRVVAEGVETLEQARFLRGHGCDEAQGFLFSRALSADAAGRLFAAGPLPVATQL